MLVHVNRTRLILCLSILYTDTKQFIFKYTQNSIDVVMLLMS